MKKVSRRRLLMMVEAPFEGVSREDTYLFEDCPFTMEHGQKINTYNLSRMKYPIVGAVGGGLDG